MSELGTDFRVISKLGEGSFAQVFKVKSNRNGKFYAIKRLKKRYRSFDEVNKLPEVAALKALQGHPNVVRLVDIIYDASNGYVAMAMELLDLNLYELTTEHKKPFDEPTSLVLIYQLLKAISYMHSKNMFHRDVKPENCMVTKSTFELKLVDFGSTRAVASTAPYTEYVATRWYRAPECILTAGSYGPEVDEWAAGCMLYELLTTRPLFPGKHEIDQISRIHNVLGTPARDVLAQFRKNPNTQIPFSFPQRAPQNFHNFLPKTSDVTIDLMLKLLTYNPVDRISAADALNHPAFRNIRAAEAEFELRNPQTPFPLFFLQNQNLGQKSVPKPLPTSNNASPNTNYSMNSNPNKNINVNANISKINSNTNMNPNINTKINPNTNMNPNMNPNMNMNSNVNQSYMNPNPNQSYMNPNPNQSYMNANPNQSYMNPNPNQQSSNSSDIMLGGHQIPMAPVVPPHGYHQQQYHPPQMKPVAEQSLIEARLRAAQRIKQYQAKMKLQKPGKINQPHLYHGAAYQVSAQKGSYMYQKPNPSIVYPRLPKIVL